VTHELLTNGKLRSQLLAFCAFDVDFGNDTSTHPNNICDASCVVRVRLILPDSQEFTDLPGIESVYSEPGLAQLASQRQT